MFIMKFNRFKTEIALIIKVVIDVVVNILNNEDVSLNIHVEEFISKKATNKLVQQTKVSDAYFIPHSFKIERVTKLSACYGSIGQLFNY
ncbi:hypothetical protein MAR_002394 [Mya arenaria]|uniref:Uncharacterized protein n=1 Tax=Mya arenaria TaxID=6604 RepID=A0ABY7FIH5_MYAAR|nr:hypothetical protein MAR_002394 [Mya arenaria]